MSTTDATSSRSAKHVPEWLNSPAWYSKPSHPLSPALSRAQSMVEKEENKPTNDSVEDERFENEERSKHVEDHPITGAYLSQSNSALGDNARSILAQGPLDAPYMPSFTSRQSDPSSSFLDGKGSKKITSGEMRAQSFAAELAKKRIHIAELQRLASEGIPDSGGVRAITWKLLLGYLPKNREARDAEASKRRAEYAAFREELLVNPSEVTRREGHGQAESYPIGGLLPRQEISHGDHPLSLGTTSLWNQFFQDLELVEQIDRDVKRTHPDMDFFSGDSDFSRENQEAMKRALFIFAKLNPGIKYVQGMNEVLAPLYYVFKNDPDTDNMVHAEADAFFCFVELLSDVRDNFCKQLDNSAVGVHFTMGQLTALLKKHDEELWRHLDTVSKVNAQFYAFRWITLLLTQEFDFPDILRLWDSLLSNPDGPLEILLRVCCAMLICVRSRLLAGDFTDNLKLLQHFPSVDVHHILKVADEIKDRA